MDEEIKKEESTAEETSSANIAPDEVTELKKQLEESKAKCEEYLNGWKRERADFLNYKKDEMQRIGDLAKYANEEVILNIIPILDNIYLAELHLPEELKNHQWVKGFNHIKTQLADFLQKEGIEPIKTVGEKFDPNTMEAAEEIEAIGKDSNVVIEEVQKGYAMHGKIIRVARVKISK